MPLSSLFSDLYTSLTVSPVNAEAPPTEEHEGSSSDPKAEEEKRSAEPEPKEEEPAGEGAEAEEEEPEDLLPAITEECSESKECKPAKHHYDECVERVTAAAESEVKGPTEDCVEEFFHLVHCSAQCAAPKIWAKLK